jgi:integration host factor subunit beta
MGAVTKQDLIVRLAMHDKLLPKEAEGVVTAILDRLKQAMADGERIEIRGFGAFYPHERAPRQGRNPRTRTKISIPAKRIPAFKPSPAFTKMVNGEPVTEEDEAV